MNAALLFFRIISIFNLLLAPLVMVGALFSPNPYAVLFFGLVVGVFGLCFHMIRGGLIDYDYRAWVAGIIVAGMYTLSIFFPLGIMGLYGLLNRETRREFRKVDEDGDLAEA